MTNGDIPPARDASAVQTWVGSALLSLLAAALLGCSVTEPPAFETKQATSKRLTGIETELSVDSGFPAITKVVVPILEDTEVQGCFQRHTGTALSQSAWRRQTLEQFKNTVRCLIEGADPPIGFRSDELRKIPGLTVASQVDDQDEDACAALRSADPARDVEPCGYKSLLDISCLEVKYLIAKPAIKALSEVEGLYRSLDIEPRSIHVHLTAPLPQKTENRRDALLAALWLAYFHRNINLASQLIGVDNRVNIREVTTTTDERTGTAFNFLRSMDLYSVVSYVYCSLTGCQHSEYRLDTPGASANAKLSWVGLRGASRYGDSDAPIFGMEYRVYNRPTRDKPSHLALIGRLDEILANPDLHVRLLANLPGEVKQLLNRTYELETCLRQLNDGFLFLNCNLLWELLAALNFNEYPITKSAKLAPDDDVLDSHAYNLINPATVPPTPCLLKGDPAWWKVLHGAEIAELSNIHSINGPSTPMFLNVPPLPAIAGDPDNAQLYMRLHNWACDPLLTDGEKALGDQQRQALRTDQLAALTKINSVQSAIEQMALLAEKHEFQKHTLAWLKRLAN